jgi:hypothetical protein
MTTMPAPFHEVHFETTHHFYHTYVFDYEEIEHLLPEGMWDQNYEFTNPYIPPWLATNEVPREDLDRVFDAFDPVEVKEMIADFTNSLGFGGAFPRPEYIDPLPEGDPNRKYVVRWKNIPQEPLECPWVYTYGGIEYLGSRKILKIGYQVLNVKW